MAAFDAQAQIQALQRELQQVRERLPAANSALIPHLTLPQYKGREDPRTFGNFIKELNRVGSAMSWNEAKLAQVLPCLISADALAIYDVLPDAVKTDWRQLTTEMAARLNNQNDLTSALAKLLQRSQRAGESISEFGMAVRDLVRRAYTDAGGFDDAARIKWEILHFRRGLTPRVKLEVGRLPVPDTLDAAISEAIAEADRQKDFQQDLMRNDQLVAAAQLQLNNQELRNEMDQLRKQFSTLSVSAVQMPSPFSDHPRAFQSTRPPSDHRRPDSPPPFDQRCSWDINCNSRDDRRSWDNRRRGPPAWQRGDQRDRLFDSRRPQFRGGRGLRVDRLHYTQRRQTPPTFRGERQEYWQSRLRYGPHLPPPHRDQERYSDDALDIPPRQSGRYQANSLFRTASPLGMPFLAVLTLFFAVVGPAQAQLQLCPESAGGHLISLPTRQPCTPPPADIATPIQLELFLPRVTPTMVPAYRCQSITVEICTRSIFGIIEAQWSKPSSLQPISANDCWDTVQTSRFQNSTLLEQKDANTWASSVPLSPDSKLFGTICKNSTNFLTQKAEVGSLDGVHLSSSLDDLSGCRLDNHSCSRPHAVVVWESFPSRYLCTHEAAGQYTGLMTRTHVLVGALQAGFVFAHQPVSALLHSCLPPPLYAMLNEAVIRIISPTTPLPALPRRLRRNEAPGYRVVFVGPPGAIRRAYLPLSDNSAPAIYAHQLPAGAVIHGGPITTLTDQPRLPVDMIVPSSPSTSPRPTSPPSMPPRSVVSNSAQSSPTSPLPTTPPSTPQPPATTPLASYDQWKVARQEKLRREKEQMMRDRQLAKLRELEELRLRQQDAKNRELESTQLQRLSDKQRTLREQPWRVTPDPADTTPPLRPTYDREVIASRSTTNPPAAAIPTPRAQLANDINTRLQYAVDEMQNNSLNEFRSLCEQQNEQTAVINAITRFDATAGVRLLLRRDDIVAKWAGEALAVSACTPVKPDEIFWSHQFNSTCYQNTPVRYQNKTFFIQAGTRELISHAEPIPCSQRPMAVFKNATGGWNSQHGSAHVAALARDFRFHSFKQTLELSAPTTFNPDVTRVASTVTLLSAYVRRINNLERHLSNSLRLAQPTSSPADLVVKTVTDGLESIGNTTIQAGNWFHDSFVNPISDIIHDWATFVKIAAGVLLLVSVLGLLLYTSPWWRPFLPRRPHFRHSAQQHVAAVELQEMLSQRPACMTSSTPSYEAESTYTWRPLTFIPPNCSLEYATLADNMRYVEISFAGYTTHALLDTGSALSIIRPSFARDIRYTFDRLNTPHCGTTMSGAPLQFLGSITVDFALGRNAAPTQLLVAETDMLPAPVVLGMDILLSFGKPITLNLPANRLFIGGRASPLLRARELRHTTRTVPSSSGQSFRASTPSSDLRSPSPVDHLQRLLDDIDSASVSTSSPSPVDHLQRLLDDIDFASDSTSLNTPRPNKRRRRQPFQQPCSSKRHRAEPPRHRNASTSSFASSTFSSRPPLARQAQASSPTSPLRLQRWQPRQPPPLHSDINDVNTTPNGINTITSIFENYYDFNDSQRQHLNFTAAQRRPVDHQLKREADSDNYAEDINVDNIDANNANNDDLHYRLPTLPRHQQRLHRQQNVHHSAIQID